MAGGGWYPDPDGTPGRYRYWDGSRWSTATSTNPYAAPPSDRPGPAPRRTGVLIAGLALLLVVAVIVVLVVRGLNDHHDTVLDDPDPPPSSVSGWDDSSPLAGPASASPGPSKDPAVACAVGDPTARSAHPHDPDRVYGGQLSMPSPDDSWNHSNTDAVGLSFAHDVALVDKVVEGNWFESVAVGEVRAEDGFHTPQQAADGITQCIASSLFYRGFSGREDLFSKPVTVDGADGWALRTKIRVDDPGVDLEGDVSEVIVVDTGKQGSLSFFWGCVPIDDTARLQRMEAVMADLRVS